MDNAVSIEADLIESVNDLACLMEAGARTKSQKRRDKELAGARRRIEKLSRARFRAQRKAVLNTVGLHKLHSKLNSIKGLSYTEADSEERDRIQAEVASQLGPIIHQHPVAALDSAIFDGAIRAAINSGAVHVSDLLASSSTNPESFVAEYLRDNGLTKLTGDLDKTTVDRLAGAIADAYESGSDFEGLTRAIKKEFSDFTAARAKMIASTELQDAYNQSILHFGEESGATLKSWEVDLLPCPVCVENALDGEIEFTAQFSSGDDAPPAHPNCFLPGTSVTALRVTSAFRRRYKGEICILSFAGLPDLSVTPNHPVLTRLGWTPAGELKVHDYVLQRCGPSDPTATLRLSNPNHDYIETGIEKVFDSFSLSSGGAARGVPISAEAFHGDSSADNEVDVVYSAGKFSLNGPKGTEDFQYFDFADRRSLPSELARESGFCSLFDACDSSPDRIMRGGGVSFSLSGAQPGVAQELGGAAVSLLESEGVPVASYGYAADADTFGDRENAFPFQVRTAQLVKIERRQFDGQVYNLETESGVYFADSILVHNCLCSLMVHA